MPRKIAVIPGDGRPADERRFCFWFRGTLIRPSGTFSPAGEKGNLPRVSRERSLVAPAQ